MENDPKQFTNLADNPDYAQIVAGFKERLIILKNVKQK